MTFQQKYTPSQTCNKGVPWTGSAFKVAGGYVWGELYAQAAAKNVVVVGGGDPTVGCIGGWAQGGGHSPANHDFGMGSDQILEAQVVLANGKLVLANACTNSDIFWAIRGGGPGTFGVVVSTTVKAHQTAPYSAHVLALAPTSEAQLAVFQEAVSIIYESMPALADAGWSGYGNWAALNYQPIVANYYSGYNHALAAKGRTIAQMTADFAPIKARLDALVGDNKLFISSQFFTYASYVDYYTAHSGYQQPVGSRGGSSVGSWMLDAPSLSNAQSVRNMINTHTGGQYQFVLNNFWLGGGANSQVKKDGADKFSGLNPAWRDAVALNIVARGWAEGTPVAQQLAIQQDVTNNLIGTMKAMNPDGGAYMNEGDYRSPNHMEEFYGENLDRLKLVKLLRDPLGVFYCQTCVGSESWVVDGGGRLCLDFGFDY